MVKVSLLIRSDTMAGLECINRHLTRLRWVWCRFGRSRHDPAECEHRVGRAAVWVSEVHTFLSQKEGLTDVVVVGKRSEHRD